MNFFIIEQLYFNEGENTLLVNSINRVHPLLLHSSLAVFTSYFLLNKFNFRHFFGTNYILWICFRWIKYTYLILLITLYLGCWWAFQEGSWGGWWNWDISEVFGLTILYRLIFILHSRTYTESIPYLKQYLVYTLLYLYFFYTLMQLNFSLVSHNFGFQNVKSFNVELLFLLIFSVSFLYNIGKVRLIIHYNQDFNRNQNIKTSFFVLTQLLSVIIFVVSMYILIHNFMWHFTGFRFLLAKFNYSSYLLVAYNSLFLYFFSLSKNIFVLMLINMYLYIYILFFSIFFLKSFKPQYLLHLVLWMLITLVVINSSEELNAWAFFLNDYVTDPFSVISFSSRKIEIDSNFFKYNTAYEGKSFLLKMTKNLLLQVYFPNNTELYYKTLIIDNVSLILNFFFYTLLGLILNLFWARLRLK